MHAMHEKKQKKRNKQNAYHVQNKGNKSAGNYDYFCNIFIWNNNLSSDNVGAGHSLLSGRDCLTILIYKWMKETTVFYNQTVTPELCDPDNTRVVISAYSVIHKLSMYKTIDKY